MAFKEPVYLVLSRRKVERMTKNLPQTRRGEIVVKLVVSAADTAFREPTLVHEVEITDPLSGVPAGDVDFTQPFITEAEAQRIRELRLAQAIADLEQRGYTVKAPEELWLTRTRC